MIDTGVQQTTMHQAIQIQLLYQLVYNMTVTFNSNGDLNTLSEFNFALHCSVFQKCIKESISFFYFIVCNQPAADRETPEIVIVIALSAWHHHLYGSIYVGT